MINGEIISKLGSVVPPNIDFTKVILWFAKNGQLIELVGKDTLRQIVEKVEQSREFSAAELEAWVRELDWEERLELMRNGAAKIDEAASERRREVALMVEVLDLSLEILPYILMVL